MFDWVAAAAWKLFMIAEETAALNLQIYISALSTDLMLTHIIRAFADGWVAYGIQPLSLYRAQSYLRDPIVIVAWIMDFASFLNGK